MQMNDIPLEKISLQSSILTRGEKSEIMSSPELILLMASIKQSKTLIHPIAVKKKGDGYVVFAGQRRFLAYTALHNSGEKGYDKIPATVISEDFSEKDTLTLSLHENRFRSNPSSGEGTYARICTIPFFFGLGEEGEHKKNFTLGASIVRGYNLYTKSRNEENTIVKMKYLKDITGHKNPVNILRDFFLAIGENEQTFHRRALIFGINDDLSLLYASSVLTYREAVIVHKGLKEGKDGLVKALKQHVNKKITKEQLFDVLSAKGKKEENKFREKINSSIKEISKLGSSSGKKFSQEKEEKIIKGLEKLIKIINEGN